MRREILRREILTFLFLLLSARVALGEAQLPSSLGRLPDGLGVNIHFTDPRPGEMEMLSAAGFKWIRMDFGWNSIERTRGKYDFAAYERLLSALDAHHIRAVFILDYSNRFYDNDQSPHTDEARVAFAKWAAASVTHFKGRGIVWEMYNEPNIGFWRPKPNEQDYAKLALAVGKAIRQAAPDEIYMGPACSRMDFAFLEACFKAGCLEYWSAVSVHPYRQQAPETVAADYRKLRELIDSYAPKGRQIPIFSGEWGYSSAWKNFDEQKQGKYLPRELLTNVASGVPISIWYDWHDDGTNPREPEHHFGTVHHDYHAAAPQVYEPKPAYLAMRALSDALRDARFGKRVDVGQDADWVLMFDSPSGARLAVWTTGKPHEASILMGAGRFAVTDYLGQHSAVRPAEGGMLKLTLTDAPQYVLPAPPGR